MLLFLFLLWMVFNGRITLEVAVIGLIITAVSFLFLRRFFDYSLKKEGRIYRCLPKVIWAFILLIGEIFKANLQVIKLLLHPKKEVRPVLVTFRGKPRTDLSKAALADSITLTPGTITVQVEKDMYTVHCLDESMAEGLENSLMEKKILSVEEDFIHDC